MYIRKFINLNEPILIYKQNNSIKLMKYKILLKRINDIIIFNKYHDTKILSLFC